MLLTKLLTAYRTIKDHMVPRPPELIGFEHSKFTEIFSSYDNPLKHRVRFCWFVLSSVCIFTEHIRDFEASAGKFVYLV